MAQQGSLDRERSPIMYIYDRLNGAGEIQGERFSRSKQNLTTALPIVETAKLLVQLRDAGAYPGRFQQPRRDTEGTAMFQAGKAAMIHRRFLGCYRISSRSLGEDLDIVPFPDIPGKASGKNDWLCIQNEAYAIGASSKVKEAAVKFVSFMFSRRAPDPTSRTRGSSSPRSAFPIDLEQGPSSGHQSGEMPLRKGTCILIWDVMLGQQHRQGAQSSHPIHPSGGGHQRVSFPAE